MKKSINKIKQVIFHLTILGILLMIFFKYSEEITELKAKMYYFIQDSHADSNIDFTDYPKINHIKDGWYETTRLIYHACGGIDGLDHSNSKEALEKLLEQERYFVEVDFMYTSDGELVCMHKWDEQWGAEKAPSLQEFISGKMYGKYTTMTAADLIQYMTDYPQLHIIIDTKEKDQSAVVKTLVDLSKSNHDVIERLIIQLYSAGVKDEIQQIYPFEDTNFLFTAYKFGHGFPNKIMKICYDENITVVTVPYGVWDDEIKQLFISKGFVLYEHTVNRPDFANKSLATGVQGLYTDFLAPEDLREQY